MNSSSRRVAVMLDLEWPYKRHADTFAGIQRFAQERGWESIIDEYAAETLRAHPERPAPYDGIIARVTRKLARRAARRRVPLVNVWFSSPSWRRVASVYPDFLSVGRLRAEHLLTRGLRRFAALISDDDRAQQFELKAFIGTLAKAGYSCAVAVAPRNPVSSLGNWRKTERAIAAMMRDWNPPVGVYIGPDRHGPIVAQMCRNRGWRVPEDVAIIAGQNETTFCEHIRPTLSSIEYGFERVGYEAALLLERLMDGEEAPAKPILLPPQGLIARESTDFFAVDDERIAAALAFIAANCHLPIGIDEVAQAVATEPRTLQRHFQKHLQRPIATEIRRVRMERAKRELAQTDRSIAEISRSAGFGPPMRMYEVFMRELGIPPSEYRHQRQNEQ